MSTAVSANPGSKATLVRELSLTDGILLVVGTVIGSGIFANSADVAAALPAPVLFLGIWAAGGVICFCAAVAVAELGAMYPEAGGQYVYLREAFGDVVAFLYGWMMFVAGGSGGCSTLAVAFAAYFGKVLPILDADKVIWSTAAWTWKSGHLVPTVWHLTRGDMVAVAAIAFLTVINVLGVRRAVTLQNAATWLKYIGIAGFIVLGFVFGKGTTAHFHLGGVREAFHGGFYPLLSAAGVAFIAVFWSYDGWVYVSAVGGEIRDAERNIPRSLILGIAAIVALYMLANAVYLYALPTTEIARHTTVAEYAAETLFAPGVARWFALLVSVVCFGALSCCLMANARIVYAMAHDGLFFRRMGDVHSSYRTPAFALVAQGLVACVIALSGTFDQLFTYSVFGMTLSYIACVIALFVLRRTRPSHPRPYRCAGYPWFPALYVVLIGAWILNTVVRRPFEAVSCLGLLAVGLPGFLWWKKGRPVDPSVSRAES
jgi:APA family basic amino acid/polyamine antiporter